MKYKSYNIRNIDEIKQLSRLSKSQRHDIDIVARVLPFKTNNYVVDELINWDHYEDDPIFVLNFPQRGMLTEDHYNQVSELVQSGADRATLSQHIYSIRMELNPHPAGQREFNIPILNGEKVHGMQHKYRETVLFFPSQGQTCHAFCTFCFRWPQFTGINELRFAMKQADLLVEYIRRNPGVTDVLFTGGDPMVMSAGILGGYINTLLEARLPNLRNIRIGTKSLAFWPYRYLTDNDSVDILNLFKKVTDSGKHLAFMAHFSHPAELKTTAVQEAIGKVMETGAKIRTQSPILNHINADPFIWAEMWKKQVSLGLIPYYMFVPRDTGARHFFILPLYRSFEIYRNAYRQVSGICRTVRGPSMSASPGKIQIVGTAKIHGEKVFVLRFLQGRNPEWVGKPFFAVYNEKAQWLTDLKPAFGRSEFFYSEEFRNMLKIKEDSMKMYRDELNSKFDISPDNIK
ncbi:MAG: lysine 2,3-aminomutase [Bacteroides sp. SM23_62_1]|nr:MAG: lysine 2,3-aminomutase [Bacteroides sp. SM23_62_1]